MIAWMMKSWKTSTAKMIAYYAHNKNWWLLTDCRNAAHSEGEWVSETTTVNTKWWPSLNILIPLLTWCLKPLNMKLLDSTSDPSGPLVLNEATELQDHSVLKPEQRAAAPHLHPLHCIKTPPHSPDHSPTRLALLLYPTPFVLML